MELARLCSGLPLALRIIAALLADDPALPLTSLIEDLADPDTRLDGLAYGEREVSTSLDLSWQHLLERDERAARLLLRLPINPGPEISSAAAAALDDQPQLATRRRLRTLRHAYLIEPSIHADHWRMHDVVRLYARRLAQSQVSRGEWSAGVTRLLHHYFAAADAANKKVIAWADEPDSKLSVDRDNALAWLEVERQNLVEAVLLAADSGHSDVAVDLSLAVSAFLRLSRHFDDYVVTATVGLRAAGIYGDPGREAMAVTNLGFAPRDAQMWDEVIDARRQACVRARESGDRGAEAWALTNLGAALWAMRRYVDVIEVSREASTVFHELGDAHHEGWALTMLGLALEEAARVDEAIDVQRCACSTFRGIEDRGGEAWALTNLGAALRHAGRFNEAVAVGKEAQAIFRENGDRIGEGATLSNLGGALCGLGRFEEAIHEYRRACAIFREAGERQREATALTKLGVALRGVRRLEEAVDVHKRAVAAFDAVGDRYGEARSLTELALTLREVSQIFEARRKWERAIGLFREVGTSDDVDRVRSLVIEAGTDRGSSGGA